MRAARTLAVGAVLGSAAGAIFLRRRSRSRDRVELYFDDGSLVTVYHLFSQDPTPVQYIEAVRWELG